MIRNSAQRYGVVSIAFHGVMAVLVLGMFGFGLWMTDLPPTPFKFEMYALHKSTGMLVLFLLVLRYGWRLANVRPLLPADLPPYATMLAHLGHLGLYGLMLAMPISGWLMSSAAGFPVSVFGLFTMPDLVTPSNDLRELMGEIHELGGWALVGLAAVHAAAALHHHFVRKDDILVRMFPFVKKRS